MEKQVNKQHYTFAQYASPARWVSYFHQLDTVLGCQPRSVLEIGVGDKVFAEYLQLNTDIQYTGLDVARDLQPDIVGDVRDIPAGDNSYDTVAAFEVLEHLPFSEFESALAELRRVAREYIIISLPHFGPPLKLSFKIPFLREVKLLYKIPYHPQHEFNGEHYWEIGKRDYTIKKVRSILRRYFDIERDFVPFESVYHHFFVLKITDHE